MTVAVCLDDKKGMMFNNRRQSRDSELIKRLLYACKDKKLYINEYSRSLFESGDVFVSGDFLDKANTGDICFVENRDVLPYINKINKLMIYHWNKTYPADTFFNVDLNGFELVSSVDFTGSSHDIITETVYVRKN